MRIPRTNMMMGICSLSREGKFEVKGDARVMYTTMMLIRQDIVTWFCPMGSLQALKLAIRYGAVRRQFHTVKGQAVERKVLDYQTFQSNLTPLLAQTIKHVFVGFYIKDNFKKMTESIDKGDYSMQPVMHHLLAGLKACVSEDMVITLDKARRACGGAGY